MNIHVTDAAKQALQQAFDANPGKKPASLRCRRMRLRGKRCPDNLAGRRINGTVRAAGNERHSAVYPIVAKSVF